MPLVERSNVLMDRLVCDVRTALRSLRHSPAFTVTVVAILGAGIGMAVAMFTVIRAVLIQRLPILDQDRIVVLWTTREGGVEFGASKKSLEELGRETRTLRTLAGVGHWGTSAYPLADGGRTIVLNQAVVDGNFFDVVGARPVLGRLLTPADELGGRYQPATYKALEHAIVISYGTWIRQFGGNKAVIGHRLTDPYSQWTYTIVGVAPPGLDYPVGVEYWIPAGKDADIGMIAVGRLRPGVGAEAARAEFRAVVQRLTPQFQLTGAVVRGLPEEILGNVRPALVILTAAVGLLLLIACVNVANLLLLRAAGRSREMAIRRAMGALYTDVVQQLFVESGLLAIGGGLLGLLCALALLHILLTFAPAQLPRTDAIRVTGDPLMIAVVTTGVSVVLFGVMPALMAARADLGSPLRVDSRSGGESQGRRRLRDSLVATQVALALVMLAGAGLLSHSLARLQQLNLGYRPDHLGFFAVALPLEMIDSQPRVLAFGNAALPRLKALPGIATVTPIILQPFFGPNVFQWSFELEGQAPSEAAKNPPVPTEAGDADYFRTFGIPIVRGRGFSPQDGPHAPLEVVVSQDAAQRFWPGQDPIGKRIRYAFLPDSTWRTVVGVASDVHLRLLREATPTVFLRWRQSFWQGIFAVRTTGTLASEAPAIRRTVHGMDPRLSIWGMETMDQYLDGPLAEPRLNTLLLSGFGLIALVLAAMGLYGVMASAVRQQTRDIGVRMALGATRMQVRQEVLRGAMAITAVGMVAGLAVAVGSSRLLKAVLFEVSPTDPLVLLGACMLLLGVATGAAYLPARRATLVDPVQALRSE